MKYNNKYQKKMKRNILVSICAVFLLFSGICQDMTAQSRRDKEQTYILETPYEVTKLTPPRVKRLKT